MKASPRAQYWAWCFVLTALVATLFPVYWVLTISLKTEAAAFASPPQWFFEPVWDNYAKLHANEAFRSSFFNSLVITVAAVLLSLAVSAPAAYALCRMSPRGTKAIAMWLLLAYMLPEFLFIIPMYGLYQWAGLYDTHAGMALVYQAHVVPFSIWMLRSFFAEIPRALDEAAALEGCGHWRILFRIYLPSSLAGVSATAVLNAIWVWNELAIALGLTFADAQTVTVGVTSFRGYASIDWGAMAAASIIALAPMLLLSFFAQRHIVKGLTLGAVKG